MNTQPTFQQLVAANRRAGRLAVPSPAKEDAGEKVVQSGMYVAPEERAQARALAQQDGRSVSAFMRRIYLRGLAGYLAENGVASAAHS